nr:hypothetical protein [Klebsiella pneumoniae]
MYRIRYEREGIFIIFNNQDKI